MRPSTRDEIIEDRVRHIIPQLEKAERLGRHEYVKLSPVDTTVLVLLLKEKVAELTMKRYATDAEEIEIHNLTQPKLWASGGVGGGVTSIASPYQQSAQLAAQQAAHMKAHQQALQAMELVKQVAPKKRKLFNW